MVSFGHLCIWLNFLDILDQFWPKIESWEQFVILCTIHTQWLKKCGKMVLFFFLDLLVDFGHFGVYFGPNLTPTSQNWYLKTKICNFYAKFILSAWNCCSEWYHLVFYANNCIFWTFWTNFGQILTQLWPKIETWKQKLAIFVQNPYPVTEIMWKMVLFFSLDLLV